MSLIALSDSSRPKSLSPICWLVVLISFIVALLLGISDNDFPFYYHVDEPGKARQILTGERNLHHPLLMLNAVNVLNQLSSHAHDPQSITELGRWTSALYSAGAVGILAFLLASYYGTTIAAIGGFIAATHWNIFELAHYFKEDPALSFGFMMAFLGLHSYLKHRSVLAAILWGIGLALAASGKYIGVLALLLIPLGFYKTTPMGPKWLRHFATLLVSFGLFFAIINWQMFVQPDILKSSLNKETKGVLEGGQIATHSFFHFGFFNRFYQVARVAAIPGILLFLMFGWSKLRDQSRVILALITLPFLLATLLGFSQKDSGRYYLPAVYGVCALAALGWKFWIDWLWLRPRKKWTHYFTCALALVTLGGAVERLWDYHQGFNEGSREAMGAWIKENLPSDAVIAQSYATKLPDPSLEERGNRPSLFPQTLITMRDLQEKITVEELKSMGATHLAATETEWKVFVKSGKVRNDKEDKFASTRTFWKQVWENNPPVFERSSGKVGTHNPPMKLWQLP